MKKAKSKNLIKGIWHFIWDDNSIWSWIVNIILAFILIKFLVYPLLSLVLSTSHPIVAVVSSSMEHNKGFDKWWDENKGWYINNNITKGQFESFPMKNGFNRGDIIILIGKQPKDIKIGDIIVFRAIKKEPIIHRAVKISKDTDKYIYSTKGDNNKGQIRAYGEGLFGEGVFGGIDETSIHESLVIGNALFKIPLLGYVKILSVELVCNIYPFNFCR